MSFNEFAEKRTQSLEKAGIGPREKKDRPDSNIKKKEVEDILDRFLLKIGIKNAADRTDENGWRYFAMGSATGRASAVVLNDNVFLRLESMIMELPSDKELLLPLYRELLEINYVLAGAAHLSISETKVFLALTYPSFDLTEDEIANSIFHSMSMADDIDDKLIQKYGTTTVKRQ